MLIRESISSSISELIKHLKDDPDYYFSWQSNIAMGYFDEAVGNSRDSRETLHTIANDGAKRFLDNLVATSLDESILLEKYSDRKYGKECVSAIQNSRSIPKDMKEPLISMIDYNQFGTYYDRKKVYNLKKPNVSGKSFDGVDIGADKDGYFVLTHRARSKSKESIDKIPIKDIKFIKSTG